MSFDSEILDDLAMAFAQAAAAQLILGLQTDRPRTGEGMNSGHRVRTPTLPGPEIEDARST